MTTLEIITLSVAAVLFGIMLIPTAIRLLSRESVVLHLLLYMSLGLVTLLAILIPKLELILVVDVKLYSLTAQGGLLALPVTFGALTLGFLKKQQATLIKYWSGGLIIFGAWAVLAFNVANIADAFSAQLLSSLRLAIYGLGWLIGIATALIGVSLDFRKPHPTEHLNRLRYWVIVSTLLIVSGIVYFVSPNLFNWAGIILLTVGSMLAGYLVLSYHTPDLRLLIGRTVRYSAIMVILFTIYFISFFVVLVISRNNVYEANATLAAIVLALLLANLTNSYMASSNFLFDQHHFWKATAG